MKFDENANLDTPQIDDQRGRRGGFGNGGIENEVGIFRRNHWVPVPQARDLDDLNAQLLVACQADEARILSGREQAVGVAMAIERKHLLPVAEEGRDLVEFNFSTVGRLGCVEIKTNAYSVPVPAGTTVEVRLSAATVAIWHAGRCVATHERCYGRQQEILDLEHYLDVLSHKPGALAGSKPLAQWRKRGRWPARYDRFWQGVIRRHERQAGTKAMIDLLQLGRRYGHEPLRTAIETALDLGCTDSAAVRYLLTSPAPESAQAPVVALGTLAQYERPLPDVGSYDQLLEAGGMRR